MDYKLKKINKIILILICLCLAMFFLLIAAVFIIMAVLDPAPDWIGALLFALFIVPMLDLIIIAIVVATKKSKIVKQKTLDDFDFDLKKIDYEVFPAVELFGEVVFKIEFLESGIKFNYFFIDLQTNEFIPVVIKPKKKFNPADFKQESLEIPCSELEFAASCLRNKPASAPMFLLKISYLRRHFHSCFYAFAEDNDPMDFITISITRDVMFNLHKFNIPFENASVCLDQRIDGKLKAIKKIRIGINPLIWYISFVTICFAVGVGIGVLTENSTAGIWISVPLIIGASSGLARPKKIILYEDFVYRGISVRRADIDKIEIVTNAKNKEEIVLYSGVLFLSFNFSEENLKFIKDYLKKVKTVDNRKIYK